LATKRRDPSSQAFCRKWISPTTSTTWHWKFGGYELDIWWYGSVSKPCTPVVHIKIAGKWMFVPLKMVLIGIDPYPYMDRTDGTLYDIVSLERQVLIVLDLIKTCIGISPRKWPWNWDGTSSLDTQMEHVHGISADDGDFNGLITTMMQI
jgi:hypothetical protein